MQESGEEGKACELPAGQGKESRLCVFQQQGSRRGFRNGCT